MIVITLGMILCACSSGSTFSGSKSGDEDHFDIEFEVLNTSYSHDLDMKAGESIDVAVTCDEGKISVLIAKGDDEPAYRGNDMETSNFNVGIKDAGKYTLTVTGEDAKGHVVFTRRK